MGHAKIKIKSSIGVVWLRGFLGFKKWRKKKTLKVLWLEDDYDANNDDYGERLCIKKKLRKQRERQRQRKEEEEEPEEGVKKGSINSLIEWGVATIKALSLHSAPSVTPFSFLLSLYSLSLSLSFPLSCSIPFNFACATGFHHKISASSFFQNAVKIMHLFDIKPQFEGKTYILLL